MALSSLLIDALNLLCTFQPMEEPLLACLDGGVIAVAAGGGILEITGVLPEGKGRMKSSDFINGRRISVGDVLR